MKKYTVKLTQTELNESIDRIVDIIHAEFEFINNFNNLDYWSLNIYSGLTNILQLLLHTRTNSTADKVSILLNRYELDIFCYGIHPTEHHYNKSSSFSEFQDYIEDMRVKSLLESEIDVNYIKYLETKKPLNTINIIST